MLRDIIYEDDYRSGEHNILNEVFRASLRVSTIYWRAVGYFSSSALEALGAPLSEFIRNGGSIRLITSVELMPQDIIAIEKGLSRRDVCAQRIEQTIEEQFFGAIGDGVSALAALLEIGRLEIRIAEPKHGYGIYHEKVGIFFDGHDYVAFSGSTNESANAFKQNYECIDIFSSWESPRRALRKLKHFEALWENEDPGATTYPFPDAAKAKLIRVCAREPGSPEYAISDTKKLVPWAHQNDALVEFIKRERGVLNMATGTGKTRVAMNIMEALDVKGLLESIVVVVDGNDLLDQWYRQVLKFALSVPNKFSVFRHFGPYKEIGEYLLRPKRGILVCSRQYVDLALRRIPPDLARKVLLIHDEVHALGSAGNRNRLTGLSDHIRFRLGLSATPEREYDEEGNRFIEEHIGPVIFNFELENAIENGILVPFNYFPLEYIPTAEDRQQLANVYKMRSARAAAGSPMSDQEVWTAIAKVYKTSRAKLPIFSEFIKNHPHLLTRSIVFVETQEFGEEVLEIIHKIHPHFHTYFSGEEQETLKRFARGELECLITCHRLSEGIDVQSLSSVILFSSDRARLETIQRMGRCLRRDPNSPNKMANVVDFIRVVDGEVEANTDQQRRDWLSELSNLRPKEGKYA